MRSDPFIIVTCDRCDAEEEVGLTALAQGAYDERNVDGWLRRLGWTSGEDAEDLCEDCTREAGKGA